MGVIDRSPLAGWRTSPTTVWRRISQPDGCREWGDGGGYGVYGGGQGYGQTGARAC